MCNGSFSSDLIVAPRRDVIEHRAFDRERRAELQDFALADQTDRLRACRRASEFEDENLVCLEILDQLSVGFDDLVSISYPRRARATRHASFRRLRIVDALSAFSDVSDCNAYVRFCSAFERSVRKIASLFTAPRIVRARESSRHRRKQIQILGSRKIVVRSTIPFQLLQRQPTQQILVPMECFSHVPGSAEAPPFDVFEDVAWARQIAFARRPRHRTERSACTSKTSCRKRSGRRARVFPVETRERSQH